MDIALILTNKFPGAQWVLTGNTLDGLQWLDDAKQPTEAELAKLWPIVELEQAVAEVKSQRQRRYAGESDPIFFQWQRGQRTEKEWLDAVAKIEADLPIPKAF